MTATLTTTDDRYCVFRTLEAWFALPALCVREICPRPRLIGVPTATPTLAGICHLRNEFLAVIRLKETTSSLDVSREQELIVVTSSHGTWGLLANHVYGLESLEATHMTDYANGESWSSAVLGSALYRNHAVKLLEPNRLYRIVEQSLNRVWSADGDPRAVACSAISR